MYDFKGLDLASWTDTPNCWLWIEGTSVVIAPSCVQTCDAPLQTLQSSWILESFHECLSMVTII